MVFSNPTFLFIFLPVALIGHLALRHTRWRVSWLLLASVVFYFWGAAGQIWVIAAVALISYFAARFIGRSSSEPTPRWIVAVAIALLLTPLFLFKYFPHVEAAARIIGISVGDTTLTAEWALPLGISFFTFHAISYVVDVSRRVLPAERSMKDYFLYLFIFPHQIAGPIVRYSEIVREIKVAERFTTDTALYGITRFAWGLGKKVLIADQCGIIADGVFTAASHGAQLTGPEAWIGALAYTFQIYFDFSGYSDMAIGLALLLGFRFPENFNSPYRSVSVTDFWRRWHMTLSRWFRDYVYISLGGNRHGKFREYAALVLTFLLTALWHGSTVNFLIWGGLHSLMIVIERLTGLRKYEGLSALRRIGTFVFVVFSWVPFRAQGFGTTVSMWRAMVEGPLGSATPTVLVNLTLFTVVAMAIAFVSIFGSSKTRVFGSVFGKADFGALRPWEDKQTLVVRAAILSPILLIGTLAMVMWSNFSPFLYFQF